MGIGAALAMGLVQGFTRNIQTEQARRQAEDERISSYQEYVVKALSEGNKSGADAIQELISSAQEQKRPAIGLLGRRAAPINLDMSNIQTALLTTDEFGTTFGTGDRRIGFKTKTDKIDAKNGGAFLAEMTGFVNESNYQQKLDALTDGEFITLYSKVDASRVAYENGAKENVDPNLYVMPDVSGLNRELFFGLNKLDEYRDARFPVGLPVPGTSQISQSYDVTRLDTVAEQYNAKHGSMPSAVGWRRDAETGTVTAFAIPELETDGQKQALQAMAENMGVQPHQVLSVFQNRMYDMPNISTDKQVAVYNASIFLAQTTPYIMSLDPDRKLKQTTVESAKEIMIKARKAGVFDMESLTYALAMHMQPPEIGQVKGGRGAKTIQYPKTVQQYVLDYIFGEGSGKTDKKEVADAQFALDNTVSRINDLEDELLKLVGDDDTNMPIAVEKFAGSLYAFFSLDAGVFGGLLKKIGFDGSPGQNPVRANTLNVMDDENLTYEYSQYLEKLVRDKTPGTKAAQLEAMRISLAFEMARAADPSGRLSNQDIELQLRKLGGDWMTLDQALSSLQEVKKEFAAKQAQYAVFTNLIDNRGVANAYNYMMVDAAIAADHLIRKSQAKLTGGSSPDSDKEKPIDTSQFGGRIQRLDDGTVVDTLSDSFDNELKGEDLKAFEAWERSQQTGRPMDASLQSGNMMTQGMMT